MSRPPRLDEAEADAALGQLTTAWRRDGGRVHRRIECGSFAEAFGLMTTIALVAAAMDHHPDWSNAGRIIEISLTTHSAGGLTALDFELAGRIDALAG